MPSVAHLYLGNVAKVLSIVHMFHPYALIREKWPNTRQMERVEGLVLVQHEYCILRWVSPANDEFIMKDPDFPNKDIYDTLRMFHITEDGPQIDF